MHAQPACKHAWVRPCARTACVQACMGTGFRFLVSQHWPIPEGVVLAQPACKHAWTQDVSIGSLTVGVCSHCRVCIHACEHACAHACMHPCNLACVHECTVDETHALVQFCVGIVHNVARTAFCKAHCVCASCARMVGASTPQERQLFHASAHHLNGDGHRPNLRSLSRPLAESPAVSASTDRSGSAGGRAVCTLRCAVVRVQTHA